MMYERYEELLKARKCKTSQVCKATGVDPSTISHWKKGDYVPKQQTIVKIAQFFDVPVEYFNDATFVKTYERNPYMDRIRYYVDKLVSMKDEDREMVESMIERLSDDKTKD